MDILLLCPAKIATGGTESIHNLACHLRQVGANAKILYTGTDLIDPQPNEYEKYDVPYITEYPNNFKGCVIFPEVYANWIVEPKYKDVIVAVNWQGVDVYDWNVPVKERGIYLQRRDAIHIANLEYASDTLKQRGLNPVRIDEVLNDDFFNLPQMYTDRTNVVLYNPIEIKLTRLQKAVMHRCMVDYRIQFKPIQGYTRAEVINLFRHSKLYLDLGQFSGRERLPREAVMCGCCIVTSNTGAAGYFVDNPIPDKYKVNTVDSAINAIHYVLGKYNSCKSDFDYYRQALKNDKDNYLAGVKKLYETILNHNTSI